MRTDSSIGNCQTNIKSTSIKFTNINSPNYPSFTPITNECVQKIVVPEDRIINIWFPSVAIKESESNNEYFD
jgi:hypothetical protein